MDWSDYYAKQAGRGVRATFLAALEARGGRQPGFAIDLGCGDGVETRALIERGWHVLAIDADPRVEERVRAEVARGGEATPFPAVEVWQRDFADLHDLPAADPIYAGFALPFCEPSHFPWLWVDLRESLRPGAVFAGEFFGPDDDWSGRDDMNFHDRAGVEAMLSGLEIVQLIEDNRPGHSFEGPKHWHCFHVVAREPD